MTGVGMPICYPPLNQSVLGMVAKNVSRCPGQASLHGTAPGVFLSRLWRCELGAGTWVRAKARRRPHDSQHDFDFS